MIIDTTLMCRGFKTKFTASKLINFERYNIFLESLIKVKLGLTPPFPLASAESVYYY